MKPTPSNLVVFRHHGPILHKMEERDLIRRAQAGNEAAKRRLLYKYHRLILKIARKVVADPKLKLDAPYLGDLVAAGGLGLLVAISRFDLKWNDGLSAYARFYIEDAIRDAAKRHWNKGIAGETRIDRYIASHPYDTPEQLADALDKKGIRCTPEAAAQALEASAARRSVAAYSTTMEGGYSEDYDPEWSTEAEVKPACSHDMYQLYGCYSRFQLSPHLRLHEATSRTIDALAVDLDKRAVRRLNAMGRRQYAWWLLRRQKSIEEDRRRHSETNYRSAMPLRDRVYIASQIDRYPEFDSLKRDLTPKRREPVAKHSPRKPPIKPRRQPRTRVWRSYEHDAAVAA
jgi:hypothetical protein